MTTEASGGATDRKRELCTVRRRNAYTREKLKVDNIAVRDDSAGEVIEGPCKGDGSSSFGIANQAEQRARR